jgi:hypothetical protein
MARMKGSAMGLLIAAAIAAVSSPAGAEELRWTHFGVRPSAWAMPSSDRPTILTPVLQPCGPCLAEDLDFRDAVPARGSLGQHDQLRFPISLTSRKWVRQHRCNRGPDQKTGGKPIGIALGLEPYFVMPGFGFALAVDFPTQLTFHNDITFDVNGGTAYRRPVGMATTFFRNRLAAGLVVKAVANFGVDRSFDIDSLSNLTNGSSGNGSLADYVLGGYGIGFDTGLLFRPDARKDTSIRPECHGFRRYQVHGGFHWHGRNRRPARTQTFGQYRDQLQALQDRGQYVSVNADINAINQRVNYSKKVNVGAEYGLGEFLKVQGGLHQGEWTAGIQLDPDVDALAIGQVCRATWNGSRTGRNPV